MSRKTWWIKVMKVGILFKRWQKTAEWRISQMKCARSRHKKPTSFLFYQMVNEAGWFMMSRFNSNRMRINIWNHSSHLLLILTSHPSQPPTPTTSATFSASSPDTTTTSQNHIKWSWKTVKWRCLYTRRKSTKNNLTPAQSMCRGGWRVMGFSPSSTSTCSNWKRYSPGQVRSCS